MVPEDAGFARGGAMGRSAPSPGPFSVHPWAAWAPELVWPRQVRAPPCPKCGGTDGVNTAVAKWRQRGPRAVLGGPHGVWYLDCKRYVCDGTSDGERCGPFFPTHPESVRRLPEEVRLRFRVIIGHRISVDSEMAARVYNMWRVRASARRLSLGSFPLPL